MKPLGLRHALATAAGVAFFGLLSCGKNADTASDSSSSIAAQAIVAAVAPKQPALVDAAAHLGFAGKLPEGTELYVGSVNFKKHLDALKSSAFWKELAALMDDKTPAPAAGDTSMAAAQKLLGDDWFIAGSTGMSAFMNWLVDFNRLYNEMSFRALMTGATSGKPGGTGAGAMGMQFMQTLLQDPAQLDRAQRIIADFDLPPLLIGFKVENPAEFAKQLIPEDMLKNLPADKVQRSTMTTPDGATLQTLTTDGSRLLSANDAQDIIAKLPPELPEAAKQAIEKTLANFQSKKFALCWGAVGDYLVFACGKNLDHVKFAATPAESLLAKPEMAYLAPHLDKNLFNISYFGSGVMAALADEHPVTPMLRGVVGAMKESDVFRDLANTLDKQLDDLAAKEAAVFHRDVSSLTAAFWWDHGIHMESYGGARSQVFTTGKPLQYAGLVDQPGVIAALAYTRNKTFEKTERAWMEQLLSMLYSSAQELVKAGLGGPDMGQKFAAFEQLGLPMLLKIYQADKDLADKALDGETAVVLDINGKMPALPGVPPETKGMKFPRITTVSEVSNRPEIDIAWKTISDAINDGIAATTGNVKGQGAPSAFTLPDPISSDKSGVTTYFFAFPYFAGDLLPCSAVNDHVLMLSTSKNAVESIAAALAAPHPTTVDGMVWRLDLGALMEYVVTLAKLSPNQKPDADKEMKQVLKWTKPFHAMQGHLFQEGNAPRMSFTWEISDLVSFD